MTDIGAHKAAGHNPTPWDDRARADVRRLRSAITSQVPETKVNKEVAPMMAELLARLDTLVVGQPRRDMAPPSPPAGIDPPSLAGAAAAIRRARADVEAIIDEGADPDQQAVLSAMVEVLDEHVAMHRDVLRRADQGLKRKAART